MRIVVTRPIAKAAGTLRKLEHLGHEPVVLPLFKPHHFTDRIGPAFVPLPSAIAATSSEALEAVLHGAALPQAMLDVPFYAVGLSTASAARKAGFSDVKSSDGDGGDLARLIVESHCGQPDRPVLYLAGNPRAGLFERELAANGIACRICETYEMQTIDWSLEDLRMLLVENPVDAVLFYSRENARAFFRLPIIRQEAGLFQTMRKLCLSANVAEGIPVPFRHSSVIARRPDEEALLECLAQTSRFGPAE